ncbi:hypothetical protein BDV93DRAFT_521180 [Ceratobasidium sp. AG-I]|nr:hypothetical protein BDV93DRAFT_521180 [Ceratobasidium sp. AG-I]
MSVFSASSLSTSDASFSRQVKPLPKRRRTSRADSDDDGDRLAHSSGKYHPSPSYYHPIYSGRVDRLKHESNVSPMQPLVHSRYIRPAPPPSRSRVVDDPDAEGDYADQLQQPNNTKKRKVPAAANAHAVRELGADSLDDEKLDDTISHPPRVNLSGKNAEGMSSDIHDLPTTRPRKHSPVTLATLRLKELLRARRKMMDAVIRDNIDDLALDFALSAPFAHTPAKQPSRAWSYGPRFRRRPRASLSVPTQREPCFSSAFTFSCANPTSARYSVAKKAAASLQLRFQAELARQTTAATEVELKTASKLSPPTNSNNSSNHKRSQSGAPGTDGPIQKSNKTKKKKRSALANASNPHHLRNYVPSRMPHNPVHPSTLSTSTTGAFGPMALKFLSASLPPRRKGNKSTGTESILVQPDSEWICPLCEYSLFYGDEAGMRKAVRNRRKVLRRRREARERAAAAASGVVSRDVSDDDDDEGSEEDMDDESDMEYDVQGAGGAKDVGRMGVGVKRESRGPHPGG